MKYRNEYLELFKTGKYIPTVDGDVISTFGQEPKILKRTLSKTGYIVYGIFINGKQIKAKGHHLVWLYFNQEKPTEGLVINHINNDRADNRLENLEMVSYKENVRHCVNQKRFKGNTKSNGELSARAKITWKVAIWIKENKGKISFAEMARKTGLSPNNVWYIANDLTWKLEKRNN